MVEFLVATLTALLLTPLIIHWYRQHNWVDNPSTMHHVKVLHTSPVPRGGGLVIGITVLILSLLWLTIDKYLIGVLAGMVILVIAGIYDDIYDLHPFIRLLTGALATLCVVGSGIGIAYVTNPLGAGVIHLNEPQIPIFLFGKMRTIWVLADAFAFLFIMWNMNIVNWSKGVDGQLSGFVSIAAIVIGILSLRFIDDPTQFTVSNLSFIVAGAFAGFTFWNFYPQKIMPGYGAGSLAGYFLAVLAILSGAKIATTVMVLGIPTADAVFTIIRRIRAGKYPWWGDRGHLHHKLLDVLGWSKAQIALFYWATTFILGWLSLHLNTMGKLITMVLVSLLVFGFLTWAKLVTNSEKN